MGKRVAFIGLGRMGAAIAACVLRSGMELTVWNRTPGKCEPLRAMGASVANTPRQAAADAEVVLTSLMDDQSILDVLQGEQGVLAGLRRAYVHACLTTISPTFANGLARMHAAAGSRYVSAPVLGRPDSAAKAQLVSLLSGDSEAMESVIEVASTYSRAVRVVEGPAGSANSAKLCLNYSVVCLIETIGEAYSLAEASGVNPSLINDFYQEMFAHPALKLYGNKILSRDFHSGDGFSLTAGLKDVTLMLDAARENGVALDIGKVVLDKMRIAIERGLGDSDWSVLTEATRILRTHNLSQPAANTTTSQVSQ